MTEDDVEKSITDYLRFALPRDAVVFHIPNGGYKLSPFELGRLKRAGYVAGIPDRELLCKLPHACPNCGHIELLGRAHFLECKGPRGVMSAAQEEMFSRIVAAGFPVDVVRSVEDVELALNMWGIPINGRLALSPGYVPREQRKRVDDAFRAARTVRRRASS